MKIQGGDPRYMVPLMILVAFLGGGAFAASRPRSVEPVYQSWRASDVLRNGIELWSRGRRVKALEAFTAASRLLPCDPVAWHNLGVALAHFGRHEEAIEAFARERFFRPGSPCAFYCTGLSLKALGRLEDAGNYLVLAVAAAPSEWLYWEALAGVLRRLGREGDAKIALRNAARMKEARPKQGIRGFLDLKPARPRLKAFPPAR